MSGSSASTRTSASTPTGADADFGGRARACLRRQRRLADPAAELHRPQLPGGPGRLPGRHRRREGDQEQHHRRHRRHHPVRPLRPLHPGLRARREVRQPGHQGQDRAGSPRATSRRRSTTRPAARRSPSSSSSRTRAWTSSSRSPARPATAPSTPPARPASAPSASTSTSSCRTRTRRASSRAPRRASRSPCRPDQGDRGRHGQGRQAALGRHDRWRRLRPVLRLARPSSRPTRPGQLEAAFAAMKAGTLETCPPAPECGMTPGSADRGLTTGQRSERAGHPWSARSSSLDRGDSAGRPMSDVGDRGRSARPRSRCAASRSAIRASSPTTTSTSTSGPARSTPCSARTAPARRP